MNPSNPKPTAVIFATGDKNPAQGGSGLRKLLEAVKVGNLPIDVRAVVSNHLQGSVASIAAEYGCRFIHLSSFEAGDYQLIMHQAAAEFTFLSGWLKKVAGLSPSKTVNIHPGPLEFGGPGMYGHHVHEAVIAAFQRGEITQSAVSMHFVTPHYDEGPTIFRYAVPINQGETADDLYRNKIRPVEHSWQWVITWLVASGQIRWDGIAAHPVYVPVWYKELPFCPANCVAQAA